jgi:hypothetical protein
VKGDKPTTINTTAIQASGSVINKQTPPTTSTAPMAKMVFILSLVSSLVFECRFAFVDKRVHALFLVFGGKQRMKQTALEHHAVG